MNKELIQSLKEHVRLSQQQAVLSVNTRMLFLYWEIGQFINHQKEKLGEEALERDVESALLKQITKFLLEMGKGFAFLSQQYHMEVGGQDYYLDLLFFHTQLNCYFIIELKIDDFKPEYAGKLNFYLNASDDLLKQENQNKF